MSAWIALLEARVAVAEALQDDLQAELSISLGWYEVLVRLADAADGRLRMQDLARSVLLSKSGITRVVDRMQDAGMVTRDACASDRRVVYAAITDRGRDTLDRALPVFARGFERTFARHLSREEARALRRGLEKVLSGNGRTATTSCPSTYVR